VVAQARDRPHKRADLGIRPFGLGQNPGKRRARRIVHRHRAGCFIAEKNLYFTNARKIVDPAMSDAEQMARLAEGDFLCLS
jgi:hypothetical protein